MTTVNGIRWTIKGVVGRVAGDSIPVDLSTQWFRDEKSSESAKNQFDLKLAGEKHWGIGAANGVIVTSSITKNELR